MLEALKVGALLPKVAARDPAIFTAPDALRLATSGGAAALGRDDFGSLEVGKQADLAIFDVADYHEIPYYFGVNTCWKTLKQGIVIHSEHPSQTASYPQWTTTVLNK